MRSFFLTIFLIISFLAHSQTADNIDSLQNIIDTTRAENKFVVLMQFTQEFYQKSPYKAINFAKQALNLESFSNNKQRISQSNNEIGRAYMSLGKYDSAIIFHEKALEIRLEIKDWDKAAESCEKIAKCGFDIGNYEKALEYYQKAIELNSKAGNRKWEARDLSDIGLIYKTKGDFDKAIEFYHKALRISEKIKDRYNSALIYNRIGSIYNNIKEYAKALEYYGKALEIRKEIDDLNGIAGSLNNIGNIYKYTGKLDTALNYYQIALEKNRELGNLKWQSFNLNNIGDIYRNQGKLKQALDYYSQSLKIKRSIRNKKGIVWTLSNISAVYFDMEEYDTAIQYYLKSLELAIEIGLKNQILHSYDNLSELYSMAGDFENAFKYSRLYIRLKDSIFNENKVKIIEDIQTKYETEKKEKENEILKNDVKHRKKVQFLLFIIISALFILTISLFFLFRIKNKSLRKSKLLFQQQEKLTELELKNKEMEKQRLEELVYAEQKINNLQQDKIKNKNRELSTVTLHILNKNKILSEIKNEIGNMCKDNENDISQFNRITNLIDGNIILDQDWEQFKKHFEEVHKGFFQNLITNFPELTNNDLRLCAYLKIHLTTKEIARLLNITIAAIKKSRQRLRKKLRLESEEDLTAYLNKL